MENLTQREQLVSFIVSNQKKAMANIAVAVLLSLGGIAIFLYLLVEKKLGDHFFSDLDSVKLLTILMLILLLELPAFLMAWAFGIASDQAQKSRKELIKLRDLDNAIELSTSLGQLDITDTERDIRSRIVWALLDKYTN